MKASTAAKPGPLRELLVIDRLEVGAPQVEKDRVTATYRVTVGRETHATELEYHYNEAVFDPADPADRNLAAMMMAQPALNYGLFCREIVLHGVLDRHDRRFLANYAAHTAREIYVDKFLVANPFLTGPAASLPAVRLETYLQAKLLFPDEEGKAVAPWDTSPDRAAVLSSGGKDSLLSYGLLHEIGTEVHPVFVNESGRHWFTALNAWRHFEEHVPRSARVWTNSDRLFVWMLSHLPFVRKDHARVRADIYPIRLWTVAVFIFGSLPLIRRRGIGRVVLGNEFDTSSRQSHSGITHYAAVYDQSRWFDEAMTRYYQRKKWNVVQFSILRPLSELLIEKVLAERYPELLRLQVSCHSAHVDGERVRPCGKCEKCRRVVSMLTALGADPEHCGYSPSQVASCLETLPEQGIHQERAAAQHLLHLLAEKQLVQPKAPAKAHPEVLALRFDPERSPHDSVPADLRMRLYRIFLEHAEGAVERRGRTWARTDPLSDEAMGRPHAFDRRSVDVSPGDANHVRLGPLTWPEAEKRFKDMDVALLPVGAIEQHGPHLPLDTDAWDAERICDDVAAACSHPRPIVLPLISYGVSYHHDDFPGTLSISPDTLSRMVYEIGIAAARSGITKLLIINGHGGNSAALHFAAQMINRDTGIFTAVDTGESSDTDIDKLTETPNDVHAGEVETSTTLALRPELVRMDLAKAAIPRFSSHYLDFTSKRSVGWYAHTKKISESGVLGDPTLATAEKGRQMWRIMVENLVEFVEDLRGMSLDEIHQRRY
jgi:creatinine amidohydrolase/Fe(II)-dependent formamide hydrolase-like protein/7-cyano-7-deazaguanine synthase in queuosine biosynthesis